MDITVVIPTYNRYTLLKRALASVYRQSYLPKEVIVVDDGSSDETQEIIKDFPNITYIYQNNSGVSATRNVGISKSSSAWIAFLDDDDEWDEKKLSTQVAFHATNPEIFMSYTAEQWIRDGKLVQIPKKYRKIGKDIFLENISFCNIAPSSVLIKKELLTRVGMFDEELKVCEDYDLWLRISAFYSVGFIPEKLTIKYAGHGNQLGFAKNLDSYRMKILEKLLISVEDKSKKAQIAKELEAKKNYHGISSL